MRNTERTKVWTEVLAATASMWAAARVRGKRMKHVDKSIFSSACETFVTHGGAKCCPGKEKALRALTVSAVSLGSLCLAGAAAGAVPLTVSTNTTIDSTVEYDSITADKTSVGSAYLKLQNGAVVTVTGDAAFSGTMGLEIDNSASSGQPSSLTVGGTLTLGGTVGNTLNYGSSFSAGKLAVTGASLTVSRGSHVTVTASDGITFAKSVTIEGNLESGSITRSSVTTGKLKGTDKFAVTGSDADLGDVVLTGAGSLIVQSLQTSAKVTLADGSSAKAVINGTASRVTMKSLSIGDATAASSLTIGASGVKVTERAVFTGQAKLNVGALYTTTAYNGAPGCVVDKDGNLVRNADGTAAGMRSVFEAESLEFVADGTYSPSAKFYNADVTLGSATISGKSDLQFLGVKNKNKNKYVAGSQTDLKVTGDLLLSDTAQLTFNYGSSLQVLGTTILTGGSSITLSSVTSAVDGDGNVYTVDDVAAGLYPVAQFGDLVIGNEAGQAASTAKITATACTMTADSVTIKNGGKLTLQGASSLTAGEINVAAGGTLSINATTAALKADKVTLAGDLWVYSHTQITGTFHLLSGGNLHVQGTSPDLVIEEGLFDAGSILTYTAAMSYQRFTSAGTVSFKSLTVGESAEVSGGSVTTKTLSAGDADITVAAGQFQVTGTGETQVKSLSVTNGGSFSAASLSAEESVSADAGSLTVTAGAQAASLSLSNGATMTAAGTVTVQNASVASDAVLYVGNASASGSFTAEKLTLNGGAVILDPDWTKTESTGAFAITAASGSAAALNGTVIVGRNSQLMIGESTLAQLTAALTELSAASEKRASHVFGENDAGAVLYVGQTLTLGANDTLAVVSSVTDGTAVSGITKGVTVGANSLLIVDAGLVSGTDAVITASESSVPFTMEAGALLFVDNATESSDGVRIAAGFTFDESAIAAVDAAEGFGAVSRLMKYRTYSVDDGVLTLYFDEKKGDIFGLLNNSGSAVEAGGAPGSVAETRVKALTSSKNGLTDDEVRAGFNKIALMNAAGGTQTAAHNASSLVIDSLLEHALWAEEPGEMGEAVWATVNGMTSRADNYRTGSTTTVSFGWKSDLAGLSIGFDRTEGDITAGMAVSLGTGSVRGTGAGSGTKNSVEYFGAHLYGKYRGDDFDIAGLAGMTVLKSEVTQSGYKGKPMSAALAAAVQVSRDFSADGTVTVTPHAGVKATHLTGAHFTAGGFSYRSSDVNLVEVPVGVRISGNYETAAGAAVKPMIDLSLARNFGGSGGGQMVRAEGLAASDAFDAEVLGRLTWGFAAGVRIDKSAHALDLRYSLKAGDGGRADQILKAHYKYRF